MKVKTKIGAKRLYNRAHPKFFFEEHLSWRHLQKRYHKTAKDRKRKFFCKKVRRMLKKQLDKEVEYEERNSIQSIGQDTMADTHTRNVLDESRQDTEPEAQR